MENSFKLRGILTDVFPVEHFNSFAKRVFWLEQPHTERYPQHWQIELHQDDCKRIDSCQIGDTLEVEVEIRGKKYTGRDRQEKIIVTLKCLGIQIMERLGTPKTTLGQYTPAKQTHTTKKTDGQGELPM